MIEHTVFSNFVFPNILIDSYGKVAAVNEGTLFTPPHHCRKVDYFENITKSTPSGWSLCPNGYAIFRYKLPVLQSYDIIIFGLKIYGISTAQGKSESLSIKLNKEDVEKYLYKSIEQILQVDGHVKSFLVSSLHEIRSLNSNMYNTVYGLRADIESRGFSLEQDLPVIKNIESLAEIQKVRSDYMDVVSGQDQKDYDFTKIPVYKKFDRLCKSLIPVAKQKNIKIYIEGTSHSYIEGIRFFDVIPYLLLHNAIKYSPANQRIDVSIEEDNHQIIVLLHSLGPKIDKEEKELIFQKGFRGKYARAISAEGNGIGLYFLKKLVKSHKSSSIDFFQEEAPLITSKKTDYYRTTFILKMQISEKQENQKNTLLA